MSNLTDGEGRNLIVASLKSLAYLVANNEGPETIQQAIGEVKACAKQDVTMDTLAPFLFLTNNEANSPQQSGGNFLTHEEALSALICLVSADNALFLKPASRSVRKAAVSIAENSQLAMTVAPPLLMVITSQITGSDVEVSTNATEALLACIRKVGHSLLEPAFQSIAQAWKEALNRQNSTNRSVASTLCVRCASVFVDVIVGIDSDATMLAAQKVDALKLFLAMLEDTDDPLVQMSMLDLLEKLASKYPMGYERGKWLFSQTVLDPLLIMAGGIGPDSEPDAILGGPALRVVAALCRIAGREDGNGFQVADATHILKGFHSALQKFDTHAELDRLAVVDAISSFSMASTDALEMILNDPITREAWISLSVAQSKLKAAILFSIALVIKHNYGSTNDERSSNLKKQLYFLLGKVNGQSQDTTDLLVSLAQSPLPELRLGAYEVLATVAAHTPTGGFILLQNSEFFSFLLNQSQAQADIERTKEGREAKFGIVEAIYGSEAKGLLADPIVQKIEMILKRGPHFVQSQQWELATE